MAYSNTSVSFQYSVTSGIQAIVTANQNSVTGITTSQTGQNSVLSGINSLVIINNTQMTGNASVLSGINTNTNSILTSNTGQNSVLSGINTTIITGNAQSVGNASVLSGINTNTININTSQVGQNSVLSGINTTVITNNTQMVGNASVLSGINTNTATTLQRLNTNLSVTTTDLSVMTSGINSDVRYLRQNPNGVRTSVTNQTLTAQNITTTLEVWHGPASVTGKYDGFVELTGLVATQQDYEIEPRINYAQVLNGVETYTKANTLDRLRIPYEFMHISSGIDVSFRTKSSSASDSSVTAQVVLYATA